MRNSQPKIVFFLSSISQPRCLKRIKGFIDAGFDVEIYGFDRNQYNINSTIENYEIVNLGYAPSGSGYFKKLFNARKKLYPIFKKNKNINVLYYSFAFDISLICRFYKKKYVYEISDLVYEYFTYKFIRVFFAKIDKSLIAKSFLCVMTSKGFYDYLYPQKKLENVIIQPNRVDSCFLNLERTLVPINSENLTFSYVGAFRYPNTVFRFAKVIGKMYPQHKFLFFGDSHLTDQVKEIANNYKNVEYHGQFKNPEDLPYIYSQINIVVACYDIKAINERIAEPNKLYESLFFNKPIVVSKNTFLEKQVLEKYKCGFAIDASKDENITAFIDNLNNILLENSVKRIEGINIKEIVDDKSIDIIEFISRKI